MPLQTEVRRLADDGSVIKTLASPAFGISTGPLCATYDPASGLLVLASQAAAPLQPVVAINAATGARAWASGEPTGAVFGLAVLPAAGVVVVGSHNLAANHSLRVHRISDGELLATADVARLTYMTADTSTSTIFISTNRSVIEVFRWQGGALTRLPPLSLQPHMPAGISHCPLCVMPNADIDGAPPQLVVGVQDAADILAFRIDALGNPGQLVSKQRLASGFEVTGLAACSSGCGLVVMDGPSHSLRVLPWPLTREFLHYTSR